MSKAQLFSNLYAVHISLDSCTQYTLVKKPFME